MPVSLENSEDYFGVKTRQVLPVPSLSGLWPTLLLFVKLPEFLQWCGVLEPR